MHKSIMMLALYGSLSVAAERKDPREIFIRRTHSTIHSYCSENAAYDCALIQQHLERAQSHFSDKCRIGYYLQSVRYLSDPVLLELFRPAREQIEKEHPNVNKTYWDMLSNEEKKKIYCSAQTIMKINQDEFHLPNEMRTLLLDLNR